MQKENNLKAMQMNPMQREQLPFKGRQQKHSTLKVFPESLVCL
jgi:hypothetical protein